MTLQPLRTKLQKPKTSDIVIERPQLFQQLDEALAGSVTLVSAPAGAGKSTLVSSWLDHLELRNRASTSPLYKSSWLSISQEENSFPRFVIYLVAAIQRSFPDRCQEAVDLVQGQSSHDIEAVADLLLQSLGELDAELLLVLDDYHLVTNPAIHAFITRLVQYAPLQLHLILISRVDPPLPLNRWRAQGKMRELRLSDLSFDLAETTAYVHSYLGMALDAESIGVLHRRTEGWVVGLRLALLALRHYGNYAEFVAHFNATNTRYIADYLVDEVLSHLPEPLQEFMLCTAILSRFSPALSAAILEIDENDARRQIEHLARENLFLIWLTPHPLWYRYHHQFQDMLLSRLYIRHSRETIATLHRRAAAWLAAHEQVGEAIHHLMAIPDSVAAADLIVDRRIAVLNQLRFLDLAGWLAKLPPHILNQRLDLLLSLAWVRFDQVDNEGCLATAQHAAALLHGQAERLPEPEQHLYEAEIVALRMALDRSADSEEALCQIRQSWEAIRSHVTATHCHVVLWLAYTSHRLGALELALAMVSTTLEDAQEWPVVSRCRIAHAAGFFHYCRGDLDVAQRRFQQNLLLAQEHDLAIMRVISRHGLAAIADTRNDTDQAIQHHLEVIRNSFVTNGRDAVVDMYALVTDYAQRGEPAKSRQVMEQMKLDARTIGTSYFLEQVTALDAYVNLTNGELKPALAWALSTHRKEMVSTSDRVPLIRARILLADGSEASLRQADEILQGLLKYYPDSYVWYRRVEVLILLALVRDGLKRPDSVLTLLAEAVRLAIPKGAVGLFMGYGDVLRRMLHTLRTQPETNGLVDVLLAAFPREDATWKKDAPTPDLPEPLTERELSVLALLAERLANKEIAQAMVVSPHTVRNHLANIFGKLQVQDRVDAVKRARELGLLR